MKFQKMIGMQMMLVGLGAALVLGTSAYAQQEVSPATFDVNPGTPAVSTSVQVAPAPTAIAKSESAVSASLWSAQNTKQEGNLINTVMLTITMIGVGAIALYAKAKSQRRRQTSPESATGAVAH